LFPPHFLQCGENHPALDIGQIGADRHLQDGKLMNRTVLEQLRANVGVMPQIRARVACRNSLGHRVSHNDRPYRPYAALR
jgi:hypothetical protein